jgi:hypothetical protein
LVDRQAPLWYECTISVSDIAATAGAVVAQGGNITTPKCEILTIGLLIKFLDADENTMCAKRPFNSKAVKRKQARGRLRQAEHEFQDLALHFHCDPCVAVRMRTSPRDGYR